jgi:hypothetical protein
VACRRRPDRLDATSQTRSPAPTKTGLLAQRRGRLMGGRGVGSAALLLQSCNGPLVPKQEAPARWACADRGFRHPPSGRPSFARRGHWLTRLTFSRSRCSKRERPAPGRSRASRDSRMRADRMNCRSSPTANQLTEPAATAPLVTASQERGTRPNQPGKVVERDLSGAGYL